ncbi:Fc.00g042480.m01.CDS01 [Cosmosporella sp. VM-42]
MAASEQNGIDILCDAAGSDLLTSLFSLASPDQRGQHPQHPQQHQEQHQLDQHQLEQQHHLRHQTPRSQSSSIPSKRKLSDVSPPASHVCHICKRVYERADHLTRHLRSHENARPYQCSRCPKRFNRADLLTRHETTHDRDGGAKGRPFIKRSDRAAEACLNCAASKAKCEDQKPCNRCRTKSLVCQMPARRGQQQYRISDAQAAVSPSEASTMASAGGLDNHDFGPNDTAYGFPKPPTSHGHSFDSLAAYDSSAFLGNHIPAPPSGMEILTDDFMYFNPIHNPYQDIDFSWDLDLGSFAIPQLELNRPSPQSISTSNSKRSSRSAGRDPSRGHAAFKRSPWIFEPDTNDSVHRETEGLALDHGSLPASSTFAQFADSPINQLGVSPAMRDRLFAMVLAQNVRQPRVPSFPSLELLNYFVQAHFAQNEHKCDALIHVPSFDPNTTIPELLCAIVASGATHISVPSIWQFGLALDEVTRVAVTDRIEKSNSTTRDLLTLQAHMLHLDVGQWSGFNRKMEIAESFVQPILTMLRRSGKMSLPPDSNTQMPTMSDAPDVLDSKWKQFISRESFKRLVMHLFFHDIQSSVGLCKNPLMSFNELNISLPASRDLWKARSAEEWRDIILTKKPIPNDGIIPRVTEAMRCLAVLDDLEDRVDTELCYMAFLHGFWGPIFSYRNGVKFTGADVLTSSGSTPPLWLKTQHQELYRHVSEFTKPFQLPQNSTRQLSFLAELFMMMLHVSPDDLQRFAGKNGEEEARRATEGLEATWIPSPDSRYAAWHAGQVLRHARKLSPTSLRGFNAIAVYFASLTLWVYGLVSSSRSRQGKVDGQDSQSVTPGYVLLDGEETRESRAFLQLDRGIPGLMLSESPNAGIEPLSNSGMVLSIARNVLRDNFPVRHEPLPPLVESLRHLLRDLGTGLAGRASRALSENP